MVRIAVCDDCRQQAQDILTLLARYQTERPGVEMHTDNFSTGDEVLDNISTRQLADLFLLDIIMPGLSGIELAREIRDLSDKAYIVFLTNSEDYALEAFNVQATQYILKPVKEDNLFPVLDKIISLLERENDDFLLVSTPERNVKIPFSSVICVESIQRKLRIYLTDGGILSSKTIRMPFEIAVAPLFQDSRFLHAHKSFILNMSLVEELTKDSFVMKKGIEIHIPRYKYADVKNIYLGYLSSFGIGILGGL